MGVGVGVGIGVGVNVDVDVGVAIGVGDGDGVGVGVVVGVGVGVDVGVGIGVGVGVGVGDSVGVGVTSSYTTANCVSSGKVTASTTSGVSFTYDPITPPTHKIPTVTMLTKSILSATISGSKLCFFPFDFIGFFFRGDGPASRISCGVSLRISGVVTLRSTGGGTLFR